MEENGDSRFQALYRCQGSCSRGRIKFSSGPLFSCRQELYLFRRLVHLKKMKNASSSRLIFPPLHPPPPQLYSLVSCNMHPSPSSVNPLIRSICRARALRHLFWLLLISNFLPMSRCPSLGGWSPTCSRGSPPPATTVWSSSSCPAGNRGRSGTRSRSWSSPPWCHRRTRWRWRENPGVSERGTGTALGDKEGWIMEGWRWSCLMSLIDSAWLCHCRSRNGSPCVLCSSSWGRGNGTQQRCTEVWGLRPYRVTCYTIEVILEVKASQLAWLS